MGEANPEAIALITSLTGHHPEHGNHPDGSQFLRIGNIVITATSVGLWSDPSVYVVDDERFALSWGGQNARFAQDTNGIWKADIQPDLLRGTARFVS